MTPIGWLLEVGAATAVAALLVVRLRRRRRSRVVASQAGRDERVVVREAAGHRELWLVAGEAATLQSRVPVADPLESGLPYTDGFHLYPPTAGAILFVGAGAAVAPRQFAAFYPGVTVHVVEHDAAVLALSERWFGLRPVERLVVELGDGREAIERPGAWARIVIDAFGAGVFPGPLATVELFRTARARLAPGGTLAVNLAGTFAAPVLAGVHAGIAEVFGAERTLAYGVPAVDADPAYDAERAGNTIVLGFRDAIPDDPPTARVPAAARAQLPYLDAIAGRPLPPPPAATAFHDDAVPPALPIR